MVPIRLTSTYAYCPRHKNAKVSSRVVLAKAIKEFGPLTQKALGYLMYQAFPGVERMKDTRKGHIFKGIMEKSNLVRYRIVPILRYVRGTHIFTDPKLDIFVT